jgi:hypothetical protein
MHKALKGTCAADAAVVHLKYLLFRLKNQGIVDPNLACKATAP